MLEGNYHGSQDLQIYKFKAIQIKIPDYFLELDKLILKFV